MNKIFIIHNSSHKKLKDTACGFWVLHWLSLDILSEQTINTHTLRHTHVHANSQADKLQTFPLEPNNTG